MDTKLFKPFLIMAIFIIIVGLACNLGGGEPTPESQLPTQAVEQPTQPPQQEPTEMPLPTPEEQPVEPADGAVSSLQDAQEAVIYIQAEGTFTYPEDFQEYTAVHTGSGFIIDPSGIAVTNNHVVTGAGLLKVWIGGEYDTTYNARLLGVSECSDLAVIDIEGEGFPYLAWYEGPIQVGMDIYTAGFPLGEPEYTLTKGIVAKEKAGGETSWASLDYVIMHDATINPGNSGGPLLNENGQVVGVNYRGRDELDQYFAIDRDLANKKIEVLRSGVNTESIGVNGEAFVYEDLSGIWVSSVQAGSVADKAGVTGGDIITSMADLPLGTDGTMADYCDILRTHSIDDTVAIEVLRFDTMEVLEGQLNGTPLVTAMTFGDSGSSSGGETSGDGTSYSEYTTVQDNDGAIQMEIPVEWYDINGSNWETNWGGIPFTAAAISASANLDVYHSTYGESGVFFAASDRASEIGGYLEFLDGTQGWYEEDCEFDSRNEYNDGYYEGKYDVWTECGAERGDLLIIAARPIDDPLSLLILVEVKITKEADYDAIEKIIDSFDVIGSLP